MKHKKSVLSQLKKSENTRTMVVMQSEKSELEEIRDQKS